ncbi:MAG: hypothetical protein B7Z55_14045 [Planctomycetales bacterium 12-60-4]|nr:MAG: hypothetical protein B7Z55_14045 [Planctomycetales bacterium 12-60-4]
MGAVITALWLAEACASERAPAAASAAGQMQAAHDGRAVWTVFPGFEAVINGSRSPAKARSN